MEMFFYAQLDADGVCMAVSQLSGEVSADNMIRLDSYDISALRKKYDRESGAFV